MNSFIKHQPLVSIIVPVYNVAIYLQKCLYSIVNQTYENWECILVNDGSTDNSEDICRKFTNDDCRFKLISQENEGVSAARNRGIDTAKGEYISFVDGDDYIEPIFLETLVKKMIDVDICVVDAIMENFSMPKLCQNDNEESIIVDLPNAINEVFNGQINACTTNKIFRSDLIKRNNIRFDTSISNYEDGLFLIEYLCNMKSKSIIHIKSKLYHYVVRDGAVFGPFEKSELSFFDAINKVQRLIDRYVPQCSEAVVLRKCMQIQREIHRIHRSTCDMGNIKHELQKELRHNLGIVVKDKNILTLSRKCVIILMAYNIPFCCFLKDILKKDIV